MKVSVSDSDKVFVPTLECLLLGGKDAITSFADDPKGKVTPGHHTVILTQSSLEQLSHAERGQIPSRITNSEESRLQAGRAREILRYLNRNLDTGYELDHEYHVGENLHIVISSDETPEAFKDASNVTVVCRYEGERFQHSQHLNAEIAKFSRVDPNIRREGIVNIEDDSLFDELQERYWQEQGRGDKVTVDLDVVEHAVSRFHPNQYLIFNRGSEEAKTLVGIVRGDVHWREEGGRRTGFSMDDLRVELVQASDLMQQELFPRSKGTGLMPRNLEQALYLHALQQEHIGLVFITGGAGTGKTVVGYGTALAQTLPRIANSHVTNRPGSRSKAKGSRMIKHSDDAYRTNRFGNIYVIKSFSRIGGKDTNTGFLPGNQREKLGPKVQSYMDAHEALRLGPKYSFSSFEWEDPAIKQLREQQGRKDPERRKDEEILSSGLFAPREGIIRLENYGEWRGRTIEGDVVFLDEAQNIKPDEMVHIIQRMGQGSQFVIGGDYQSQIDDQNMSATNNGLFYAIKHFIDEPYAAVISLESSQRHAAAAHAHRMRRY